MALKPKSSGGFRYKTRTKEQVQKRADQKGGAFDSFLKDKFTVFAPKEGEHSIRILPPTWEGADHYGMDVFVHYEVGVDKQSYICLEKNQKGKCPICDERRAVEKSDKDYAKKLAPSRRVLVWIIDRNDENTGPKLYAMPWTLDRDIAVLCVDKKTNAALFIDHPDEGFDVDFQRTGAQLQTKYIGIKVARNASPICDDSKSQARWLNFIAENPLPETLHFYEEDYIKSVFEGVSSKEEQEEEAPEEAEEETPEEEAGGEEPDGEEEAGGEQEPDEEEAGEAEEPTPTKRREPTKPSTAKPASTVGKPAPESAKERLARLRKRAGK